MSSPVSNNVPAALVDGVPSTPTVPVTHMHEDAAHIAEVLRNNYVLTRLDLNFGSIGDGGAALLANALTADRLTVLDLGPNTPIVDAGARALTAELSSHTPLAARITDTLAFGG